MSAQVPFGQQIVQRSAWTPVVKIFAVAVLVDLKQKARIVPRFESVQIVRNMTATAACSAPCRAMHQPMDAASQGTGAARPRRKETPQSDQQAVLRERAYQRPTNEKHNGRRTESSP